MERQPQKNTGFSKEQIEKMFEMRRKLRTGLPLDNLNQKPEQSFDSQNKLSKETSDQEK